MSGLETIKILELGRVFSGPLCGMVLADLGADVIKVERPGVGDESRNFGVLREEGCSCYFDSLNRNKRSVALDLKNDDDRALFRELLMEADVLVHNWIQKSLDKLGFSWEEASEINPRLVYCSISGFGAGTTNAATPSQDLIAQAVSGLLDLTGAPEGPPLKTGIPVVDYATGLYAALSITTALFSRERTGQGQWATVSLLETALAMTSFASSGYLSTGAMPRRTGNRHPAICPYNLYATSDGHVVVAVANDSMWQRFCHAIGLAQLAGDEAFESNQKRLENQEALESLLVARFATFATSKLIQELESHKVSCSPVNSVPEAFEDPRVAELAPVLSCETTERERVQFVRSPMRTEALSRATTVAPPKLGASTDAIRRGAERWQNAPSSSDRLVRRTR